MSQNTHAAAPCTCCSTNKTEATTGASTQEREQGDCCVDCKCGGNCDCPPGCCPCGE